MIETRAVRVSGTPVVVWPALQHRWTLCVVIVCVACAASDSAAQPGDEVSIDEVKRFLDPTTIVTGLDYTFSFNSLPDATLYRHLFGPGWALNEEQILYADVPLMRLVEEHGPTHIGIGDTAIGWGYVPYENLSSRFTSVILIAEARAPTGDAGLGLGTGGWVLAPAMRVAINPTDRFPLYFTLGYLHSLENEKTEARDGKTVLKLRSWEFALTTVHIMPKGFFLVLEPSLLVDDDLEVFSIVVGGGRAVTRSFAFSVGYAQFAAGDRTFNRSAVVGLQYIR